MIASRLRLVSFGLLFGLICTLVVTPQRSGAQELAEPVLWGLDDANVLDLALKPDRGVYVATNRGIWEATPERRAEFVRSSQLPGPCNVSSVVPEPGQCNVPSIAVDSNGALYAVVGSLSLPTPPGYQDANAGLYRLEANASSWQLIATPDEFDCVAPLGTDTNPCLEVPTVAIGPDDSIYVRATGQRGASPPAYDSLYHSTNGGVDWDRLPRPPFYTPLLENLAVGPDGRIWRTGFYEFQARYMFLITSGDGGQTWIHRTIDPGQSKDVGDALLVSDFAFREDRTYVTTVPWSSGKESPDYPAGVYLSDDFGETWHRLTEADASQEMAALAVSVSGEIFHSQRGEIRLSRSNGATWQELVSSKIVPFINTMAIDYDGVLWVGTIDGLFRTSGPVAAPSAPPTRIALHEPSTATVGPTAAESAATTAKPESATSPGAEEVPEEPGSGVEEGMGRELFKSDCFAAGGAYYELGDGAHGCIFPDGSGLDCTVDEACALNDPTGRVVAPAQAP